VATATDTRAPTALHVGSTRADKIWGTTRIGIGLIFLWAFFDKLVGLGFATGRMEDGTIDLFGEAAWINGGSPTYGFLNFGTTGPFAEFFQGFAGSAWADWLFMMGLFGIGLALTFGFAVRLGAYFGILLLMLMYVAAMPPEHHPFLDDHVIYAIVLLGLAEVNAGDTFGVGRKWSKTTIVERYPILR
jgi:thiosulfate dehydrogenase [quinone] large subunit